MNIHQIVGCFGIVAIFFICWLFSSHKKKFPWRVVIWGLILQFSLGFAILNTGPGRSFFEGVNNMFLKLMDFASRCSAR